MDNFNKKLERIQGKLEKLIRYTEQLQEEKEALEKENNQLKDSLENQEKHREELEKKIKLVKLAQVTPELGETEKKELKKTIQQYVQEIDKCIALLNN